MSDGQKSSVAQVMMVNRRQMIGRTAAVTAAATVGSVAMPAFATSATDTRLRIYEGKYAIDSHKIVDGYFASPRGDRSKMDVLVVIPGANGIDDAVRDTVRRHALAGKIVIAPDLAKTSGKALLGRDAMIADIVAHAPRLRRHARGSGTVTLVAA